MQCCRWSHPISTLWVAQPIGTLSRRPVTCVVTQSITGSSLVCTVEEAKLVSSTLTPVTHTSSLCKYDYTEGLSLEERPSPFQNARWHKTTERFGLRSVELTWHMETVTVIACTFGLSIVSKRLTGTLSHGAARCFKCCLPLYQYPNVQVQCISIRIVT